MAKKEKVVTKIPSRTISVTGVVEEISNSTPPKESKPQQEPLVYQNTSPIEKPTLTWYYASVAILTTLLIGSFFWIIRLRRKIETLTKHPEKKNYNPFNDMEASSHKEVKKLPDLNPT